MKFTIPDKIFGEPVDGALERYLAHAKNLPPRADPPASGNTSSSGFRSRTIDSVPWLDGAMKTQNKWIDYAKANKLIMISAPDLYKIGKSSDTSLLASIQNDFNDSYVMTGTQIHYEPTNLEAKIVHYAGSNNAFETPKIKIQPYNRQKLSDVVADKDLIIYLKSLFDTPDDMPTILQTLKKLSGVETEKTYLWTPDQGSRASTPVRAVRFYYVNLGDFHIDCNNYPDYNFGRSRGVRG